jgi:hypothetical protein
MQSENSPPLDSTSFQEHKDLMSNSGHDAMRLSCVASAQRVVNLCLFAWAAAAAFQITETRLSSLFVIVVTVAAAVGVSRLTGNLENLPPWRAGLVVLAVIPVVGLLVMALLSGRATKELRAAGYEVGLLGARKTHVV